MIIVGLHVPAKNPTSVETAVVLKPLGIVRTRRPLGQARAEARRFCRICRTRSEHRNQERVDQDGGRHCRSFAKRAVLDPTETATISICRTILIGLATCCPPWTPTMTLTTTPTATMAVTVRPRKTLARKTPRPVRRSVGGRRSVEQRDWQHYRSNNSCTINNWQSRPSISQNSLRSSKRRQDTL